MHLADLKGNYSTIYSLGDLCLAAIQLEKNDLRPFAGPIDWMGSYNLPDVSRLIHNRFSGFMSYGHLQVQEIINNNIYLVLEREYQIMSNHDFYTHNNSPTQLEAYPEIKAKYDRRIERFLHKAATSKHILFIRTRGTFEQAAELQEVLSNLVVHEFNILLVNHGPVEGLIEQDCPLERVCSVVLPDTEIWEGNNHLWTQMLAGVHLDESI
ncbi:DUF1796 family putative cysteine peptidase [Paenibacillus pini]|uniref:Papain-like cysteine peptidase n=1 Tax=Paenibacillus pini JCM 16418 TaxID=1236976 RepID=W7YJL8_9BACL|nr:DUF1796 family putative cysteine peptidase [Paenibacillus pini]GAF08692.1 hypothetical protein JCM16418_2781 [Paenibacillus pini JCM 16418]